jgi:hypothetical protein
MDMATKEILGRQIMRFMARKFGEEFDYVVIVSKKETNEPLIVHSLEGDDDLVAALHSVVDMMLDVRVEEHNKGDA